MIIISYIVVVKPSKMPIVIYVFYAGNILFLRMILEYELIIIISINIKLIYKTDMVETGFLPGEGTNC